MDLANWPNFERNPELLGTLAKPRLPRLLPLWNAATPPLAIGEPLAEQRWTGPLRIPHCGCFMNTALVVVDSFGPLCSFNPIPPFWWFTNFSTSTRATHVHADTHPTPRTPHHTTPHNITPDTRHQSQHWAATRHLAHGTRAKAQGKCQKPPRNRSSCLTTSTNALRMDAQRQREREREQTTKKHKLFSISGGSWGVASSMMWGQTLLGGCFHVSYELGEL